MRGQRNLAFEHDLGQGHRLGGDGDIAIGVPRKGGDAAHRLFSDDNNDALFELLGLGV
jgi:hypothetical protein